MGELGGRPRRWLACQLLPKCAGEGLMAARLWAAAGKGAGPAAGNGAGAAAGNGARQPDPGLCSGQLLGLSGHWQWRPRVCFGNVMMCLCSLCLTRGDSWTISLCVAALHQCRAMTALHNLPQPPKEVPFSEACCQLLPRVMMNPSTPSLNRSTNAGGSKWCSG